jgi:hypothetical protein
MTILPFQPCSATAHGPSAIAGAMNPDNEGLLTDTEGSDLEWSVEFSERRSLVRAKAIHFLERNPE